MTTATVSLFGVILFAGAVAISMLYPAWARAQLVEQASTASRRLTLLIDRGRFDGAIPPLDGVQLMQVVDHSGRVLAADVRLAGQRPLTRARPAGHDPQIQARECVPGNGCLIIVGTNDEISAYGPVVAYAAVREPVLLDSPLVPGLLYGSSAVLLALMAWFSWLGVGRVLAPVERIRRGLQQISAQDLSRRIDVPGTGDEVAELAVTVNDTLQRLDDAVDRHRRFVSDASHELRTPITAMLVQLEAGLADHDDPAWRAAIDDAHRLSDIVQDLLLMARLDAAAPAAHERVDLSRLVTEEIQRQRGRLPISSAIEPGVEVQGNRLHLVRVLTNLLSNADRYGESTVHVSVRAAGAHAEVQVLDDGPGIPEDMRERVFERFTRLDRARSRDTGGSGLGLPIARDIAVAHGGTLEAGDGPGGRLVLCLPLRGTDP
ncbi:HAMP domain-containing sensor histidine kinase [Nonomuraea rosea]|uniref:histidine kinase n=1 Tax=Nonomuraea rosea TaxID=638574 RepID=A0ABP7A8Y7_9ACTN